MIVITAKHFDNSAHKVIAQIHDGGVEQARAFCEFMNVQGSLLHYEMHENVPSLDWNKEMTRVDI